MKKFLIDGNNVINYHPKLKEKFLRNKENAKDDLALVVGDFLVNTKNEATIFLDGFETVHSYVKCNRSLSIKYSRNLTADEVIKRTIDLEKNKRILVVVSSDIEVKNYARINDCEVKTSATFLNMIYKETQSKTLDIKPIMTKSELEEWVRIFQERNPDKE